MERIDIMEPRPIYAIASEIRRDIVRCRCCGKAVTAFDGHPIHTRCIPKHWDAHQRGYNASRCREFGPNRPRCERYPCNLHAPNTVTIEHLRPAGYAALGEIETLTLCEAHARDVYRDARRRIGSTIQGIELDGPAAANLGRWINR